MELTIRDWMIIIIVLLLLFVVLDGYRRASREQRMKVRLARKAKKSNPLAGEGDADFFPSELPNGGARVVGVIDGPDIDPHNPPMIASERKPVVHKPDPRVLDILARSGEQEIKPVESVRQEPSIGIADDIESTTFVSASDLMVDEPKDVSAPSIESGLSASKQDTSVKDEARNAGKKERKRTKYNDSQTSLFDDAGHPAPDVFEEIIVLNVLAKNTHGFSGEDLLHILLPCDCRLGAMNIFHRYESENAQGEVQFSIVNIVEPGVFNLDNLKEFTTPGVSFFLRLPGPQDPIEAFNCMVETAQCLVRNLNGELKDERHSTVTQQTLEHAREKIHQYIKRQMIGL